MGQRRQAQTLASLAAMLAHLRVGVGVCVEVSRDVPQNLVQWGRMVTSWSSSSFTPS